MIRALILSLVLAASALAQPWGDSTLKIKPTGATTALSLRDLFQNGPGLDVRFYGAKQGNTAFDSTDAFHRAIAALPATGGTIYAPGRYACNITITKSNVRIVGTSMSDTSTTNDVLVPYNVANPVITIGDDTKYLYGVRLDNISLFGGNAGEGAYGLKVRGGVQNAHFTNLSVRNFGTTGIHVKGGDNYNCEWIFFNGLICRTPTVGNPTGMLLEYGTTWLTAIYINNYKIEGPPVGTGYALIVDSVPLGLSHGWLQGTDLHGVLFRKTWAPYPMISGVASTIEAVGGSKCGVEVYSNNRRKTDFFSGDIYISGGNVLKLLNGTVTTMVSGWAITGEIYSPRIVANAYFNDGADPTQANLKIYGSGNALYAANDAATSYWSLTSGGNFNINNAKLRLETVGKGLEVKTGTNSRAGTATLVGGTVTVANTSVTANTLVLLTSQANGGTPGFLRCTAKNAGTSFVITSSSGTDTSTVGWFLVELIP